MTAPATEPTPGAPATDPSLFVAPSAQTPATTPPAPGAPPAPSAPRPTQSGPDPNEPVDVSALPANVQRLIKDLRDENAKSRGAKGAADQARQELMGQVAKALGIEQEPASAEALAEQLLTAQETSWAAAVELAVFRAAPDRDTAEALLDSRRFIDTLDGLYDVDPRSQDFRDGIAAKVQEAVAARGTTTAQAPGAPAGPRPDPTQGTRGTAPTGRSTSLNAAYAAHYAQQQRR